MPSRRAVLRGTVGASVALTAGCQFDQRTTDTEHDQGATAPEEYVADWHEEPVRGAASPIEVTDRGIEEVQSESAVRERYRDGDLDERLDGDCVSAASEGVWSVVSNRLTDTDNLQAGISGAIGDETSVVVERQLYLDRDGGLISRPFVGFEELRAATPRTAIHVRTRESAVELCPARVYVQDSLYREQ